MKGCVVGQNGVVGLKALALAAAFVGKNEGVVTCQGALGAVGAFGVYVGGVGVGVELGTKLPPGTKAVDVFGVKGAELLGVKLDD